MYVRVERIKLKPNRFFIVYPSNQPSDTINQTLWRQGAQEREKKVKLLKKNKIFFMIIVIGLELILKPLLCVQSGICGVLSVLLFLYCFLLFLLIRTESFFYAGCCKCCMALTACSLAWLVSKLCCYWTFFFVHFNRKTACGVI